MEKGAGRRSRPPRSADGSAAPGFPLPPFRRAALHPLADADRGTPGVRRARGSPTLRGARRRLPGAPRSVDRAGRSAPGERGLPQRRRRRRHRRRRQPRRPPRPVGGRAELSPVARQGPGHDPDCLRSRGAALRDAGRSAESHAEWLPPSARPGGAGVGGASGRGEPGASPRGHRGGGRADLSARLFRRSLRSRYDRPLRRLPGAASRRLRRTTGGTASRAAAPLRRRAGRADGRVERRGADALSPGEHPGPAVRRADGPPTRLGGDRRHGPGDDLRRVTPPGRSPRRPPRRSRAQAGVTGGAPPAPGTGAGRRDARGGPRGGCLRTPGSRLAGGAAGLSPRGYRRSGPPHRREPGPSRAPEGAGGALSRRSGRRAPSCLHAASDAGDDAGEPGPCDLYIGLDRNSERGGDPSPGRRPPRPRRGLPAAHRRGPGGAGCQPGLRRRHLRDLGRAFKRRAAAPDRPRGGAVACRPPGGAPAAPGERPSPHHLAFPPGSGDGGDGDEGRFRHARPPALRRRDGRSGGGPPGARRAVRGRAS